MAPADLLNGTPVRLNRSLATPVVLFARGSIGRFYGPPNEQGYVKVMVGGCYIHAKLEDLLTLDEPFDEKFGEPTSPNDTPESGGNWSLGFRVRYD